jgi:hypothetical protein
VPSHIPSKSQDRSEAWIEPIQRIRLAKWEIDLAKIPKLNNQLVRIDAPVGRISTKRGFLPDGCHHVITSASQISPAQFFRIRRTGVAAARILASYYEWDYRIAYTPFTFNRHLQKLKRYGVRDVIQMDASCWFGEPWEKRVRNIELNYLYAHIAQANGFSVLPNFNTFWSEEVIERAFPKHVPSVCIDGAHAEHPAFLHEEKLLLTHACRKFGIESVVVITGRMTTEKLKPYVDVMNMFGGKIYFVPSEAFFMATGARAATMRCRQMNRDNEARRFHEARIAAAKQG